MISKYVWRFKKGILKWKVICFENDFKYFQIIFGRLVIIIFMYKYFPWGDFKENNIFLAGSKWSVPNLFCGDSNNLRSVDLVPLSAEIYFVYYSCSIVQSSGFWFRIYQLVYNNIWIEFIWFIIGCYIVVWLSPLLLDALLLCFRCCLISMECYFASHALVGGVNMLLCHFSGDF